MELAGVLRSAGYELAVLDLRLRVCFSNTADFALDTELAEVLQGAPEESIAAVAEGVPVGERHELVYQRRGRRVAMTISPWREDGIVLGALLVAREELPVPHRELGVAAESVAANLPGILFQTHRSPGGPGKFTYIGDSAKKYGLSPEALVGLSPTVFMAPAERDRAERAAEFAAEHLLPLDQEITVKTPSGGELRVRATSSPRRLPNGDTEFNGVIIDQSDRARLEEKLVDAQKLEAAGRIASAVAHDFNNMVSAILSCAAIATQHLETGSPIKQELETITAAAGRAAQLTRQLLTFAREQRGEAKEVQINEVIRGVSPMLRRVMGQVQFEIDLDPELSRVWLDPGQFEQVLFNLVVNARDAVEDGGFVKVETNSRIVDESTARANPGVAPGRYVVVTISDNGVGMSEEVKRRVFDPFFTTKNSGTGLGLASCYGVTKQAGGHIWIDSAPGEGSRFHVYLPEYGVRSASASVPAAPNRSYSGTERLLLVEDDPILSKVVSRAVSSLGYEVSVVGSAKEATQALLSSDKPIELVVTDVVLPDMVGTELISRLRRSNPQVPIVLVSGYTNLDLDDSLKRDPKIDFLPKPFVPSELAARIRRLLD